MNLKCTMMRLKMSYALQYYFYDILENTKGKKSKKHHTDAGWLWSLDSSVHPGCTVGFGTSSCNLRTGALLYCPASIEPLQKM